MAKFIILVVIDDRQELSELQQVLQPFEALFRVCPVTNSAEAEEVLFELTESNEQLALVICDETLPKTTGRAFLIKLHQDSATRPAHKILVVKEPKIEDLIQTVNHGGLDHCLIHPWIEDDFRETVKTELTDFILDNASDKLSFVSVLDQQRILTNIHSSGLTSWDHHS